MPQPSNTSILPIFNPELTNKSELSSGYNWKTLTKAGLVFVTTTGAFFALKTTGSFNLIASLWKNSPSETDLNESSALTNFNDPSTQTYTVPASEKQPFINHQYAKRSPSGDETVIKIGSEFQVNTYTVSYQSTSSATQLNDGKFVVTWHSKEQDGDGYGIYGQIYNANGTTYSSEFQVNTYTTGYQTTPFVTGLTNGKFVVTWKSGNNQDGSDYGIYGQMYNADGSKYSSEFQVNTYTTNHQQSPSLASLNDGKFVIVWRSDIQDEGTCGIYGQLFNADSSKYASEFQINTYTTDHQTFPAVAGLSNEKFVVTWISHGQDGNLQGIYGQLFNANGTKFLPEFQVNTYTTSDQELPSVAGLSDSKFVVTWRSNGQDGSSYGVYGQIFNANATKYASEFRVNTYTIDHQGDRPSITTLSDNKFIITWHSKGQDGDTFGVYGQAFNIDGSKYASEFQVNMYTTSGQTNPSVTELSDRKFIITWTSNGQDGDLESIFGQMFKVDTVPVLVNNTLTVNKGERITLTTSDLSANDVDDDNTALTFTVSNVQHGQFELKSNLGTPITTFTQQQIIDGNIQFVHDGSDVAPVYQVSVGDGWLGTDPVAVTVAFSSCVLLGTEFQVNTYTISGQYSPSIAGLSDGKFVVTWQSDGQDGNYTGVYGQMFNTDGSKYSSEFQVNTYTIGYQNLPSVAGLSDGKLVVTWQSGGTSPPYQDGDSYGIYGQMFNANGDKYASEFQVNTYTTSSQVAPSVAGLSDGKFAITWASAAGQDGDLWGIYGQMYNADGSMYSSEFRVNTYTTGDQNFPSVAKLSDGKFVVVWISNHSGGSPHIYGQLFNANSTKYASEFQVNTNSGQQAHPSVAGLSDGKFVATWTSINQDGDGDGVYGQMFNANGTRFLSEFQVNTYTIGSQSYPYVAGLNDGKFVVTWTSTEDQDGDAYGVYGQMFNADSTKFLSEFQINAYTINSQSSPSIAALSNGKFIVTWSSQEQDGDSAGVFGQIFKIDTAPVLVNNNLTIGKGEIVTLTTDNLSATDVDDDDVTLTFTISNVQHGQFELKSNPGTPITTFTQQQIIDENIQFVHDGSNVAPMYRVSVSDGFLSTDSASATISLEGYVPTGSEFQVNTYTTNDQMNSFVTDLPEGRFVILWTSFGQDGSDYGVYGQLFDVNANKEGVEFNVNTYTQGEQFCGGVAKINDDRFVVVWHSDVQDGDNRGIYGQLYNINATRIGSEFQVSTYTTNTQEYPTVFSLEDDRFFVTWMSGWQDGSSLGIYAQIFNADGSKNGTEFRVNTYTESNQAWQSGIGLNDDRFVIAWGSTGQDSGTVGVYGQTFNADGSLNGTEFKVNTYSPGDQNGPSLANLSDGKFIIRWHGESNNDDSGISAQMFNNDGSKNGSEFQVNSYMVGSQTANSYSTQNLDNGFIISWGGEGLDDDFGIYAQIFNDDGSKNGNQFRVNSYTADNQGGGSVTAFNDGKFIITWLSFNQDGDSYGIYAQRFSFDVAPQLIQNTLLICKSQKVTLTIDNLSATDIDNDNATLIFMVNNAQHGQFELKSNPGASITSFTQQQIIDGDIQFVHDASANSPSYEIAVSDGNLSTSFTPAEITFSLSESLISSGSTSQSIISSEASSRVSTSISSSQFSLSSETRTSSSSHSTTESTITSSKTSESEVPSSTSSISQSTIQSKTSESISASTSKEISSNKALSGFSSSTTTSKSPLGAILGSLGGIIGTITSILGVLLKYKKYRALTKLRQQNLLAAEVQRHLNLDVLDFQSKQGKKYVAVINGIVEALRQQGLSVEEMNKEEFQDLTHRSVKVIKEEVEPNKTFLRKTIPVKGLKKAKDSIIKGVIDKYVKGKDKNGIMLQNIEAHGAADDREICESGGGIYGMKHVQQIRSEDLSLGDEIGVGGFGRVYKGTWQNNDVAVKVLKEEIMELTELAGDFLREASTWSKLSHPNITQFFGICWTKPSPYIVVEYVDGGSLASHLEKKKFSQAQRFGLAMNTVQGLRYLHECDPPIWHRDIKPDNVLVEYKRDRSNEKLILQGKLTDFGTARQEIINWLERDKQRLTKGVGTPVYQAPEIMKGSQDYSEKADIYSLGVCLNEIYTQERPYDDQPSLFKGSFTFFKAVVEDGARPTILEGTLKSYAALIKKCWAKRPNKRPNVAEVERQLKPIVDEQETQQCSVTLP